MEPLFPASPLTTWNTSSVVPSGSGDENGTLAGLGPSPGARAVVVPVLYLLVCAVGLGGNALVIYVVLRHAKMKTVTNIYILNLAVADVLLMLGLPFVATQNAISYWPFGPVLCRLVMTLDGINQFTSIFCLTVMSVDRYLAVVHPIRSARWRRPRVAKLASAAVWAFSLVMSLPLVVFADIQEGWNTCNLSWPEPVGLWGAVFIIYTSVLGFFGPLLVICLCYLLIVVKLKASGVRVGSTRRRSERKVTRMVVVVVLVFAGCWLPFFIVNIVNLAFALPEEPASAGAYFFVVVLSYANSCANPLLYGFLSDNFRQSFRKVLCLRKGYGAGAEDADATEPQPGPSSRLQEAMMPVRSCKANGLMQTSKLVGGLELKRRLARQQRAGGAASQGKQQTGEAMGACKCWTLEEFGFQSGLAGMVLSTPRNTSSSPSTPGPRPETGPREGAWQPHWGRPGVPDAQASL
uniref:Somatostatin receptor 5 n=3 Tax=Bos TaxID=9903 RepID=A0A4W2H4G2_BOBOX